MNTEQLKDLIFNLIPEDNGITIDELLQLVNKQIKDNLDENEFNCLINDMSERIKRLPHLIEEPEVLVRASTIPTKMPSSKTCNKVQQLPSSVKRLPNNKRPGQ